MIHHRDSRQFYLFLELKITSTLSADLFFCRNHSFGGIKSTGYTEIWARLLVIQATFDNNWASLYNIRATFCLPLGKIYLGKFSNTFGQNFHRFGHA